MYARFTKLPTELENGPMRLAQSSVQVQIMGQGNISTFTTVEAASYFIVHELDLAAFIQRKQLLTQILQDDEVKKIIISRGLHKLKTKLTTKLPKTEIKVE